MQNLSCEKDFYFHDNRKSFLYQWLCTLPRFEREAWGNLEMAHYSPPPGRDSLLWPMRVCAAEQGMIFKVLSLKQGI